MFFSYVKTKINSYSLSLEETLTFHNVMILFNPVFNKTQNHCYYNVFLEKRSYQLHKMAIINNFLCIKYKCYIMTELHFGRS